MRITLLGTGTSHGVPMIGCDCQVCTSPDPRDRRTRTSIYVEHRGVRVLIDTGPELRVQCIAAGIQRVDAVLYTHHHADHVTGLDDLRRFNWLQKAPLPCHAQAEDIAALRRMFSYAFEELPDYPSQKPQLVLHPITGPFELHPIGEADAPGLRVVPIPLLHGATPVLGFRFENFAYCTDCNHISAESFEQLTGLEVLVLDALRKRPHPTHFNLEQAIDWARRIAARHTYFTHIAHELGHEQTNRELPPGMALGHDGLVIEC